MSDYKKRVSDAMGRYYKKIDKEHNRKYGIDIKRKKSQKPEKEVEKTCLDWMRSQGWNVEIYESKTTYSEKVGRWVGASMKAGTCDCMGSMPDGISVSVEFKAPGSISSFNSEKRYLQKEFIIKKINSNSFACVTDSLERLISIFEKWKELRYKLQDLSASREYLLEMLPKKRSNSGLNNDTLFDDN